MIRQMRSLPDRNFNPRSPCGERPARSVPEHCRQDFNPRSPCGERQDKYRFQLYDNVFQSTLPVWGATESFMM